MAEIYFEFTRQGSYVKVSAIDADSGIEGSIVGPADAPQSELERLALKKLEFVRRTKVQTREFAAAGRGQIV